MRTILFFVLLINCITVFGNFSRDSLFISRCYEDYEYDTTISAPSIKYHNTYDNNGKIIEKLTFLLSNGIWVNSSRESILRYSNGLVSTRIQENWSAGSWQNNLLDSFLYNINGHLLMSSTYQWNGTWQPIYSRHVFTYSSTDSLISDLEFVPSGSSWQNATRITHFRNIVELDSLILTESWDGISWQNSSKIIHQRNSFSTDTIVLKQNWLSGTWEDIQRHYYAIDSQQRILTDSSQIPGTGNWKTDSLRIYIYEPFGYNFNCTLQYWSDIDSSFKNVSNIEYVFDLHHRLRHLRTYTDWEEPGYWFFSNGISYDTLGLVQYESNDCVGCSGSSVAHFYNSFGYEIKRINSHFNRGGELFRTVCEYYYTSINGNAYICDSGSTILTLDSASAYLCSTGETTRQITVDSAGIFQAVLTFADGLVLQTPPFQVVILDSHPLIHGADTTVALCAGNNLSLGIPGQLYTTYQWMRNDTLLPGKTNPSLGIYGNNFIPAEYRLILSSPCVTDTSSITNVVAGQIPVASISSPSTFLCTGDSMILSASPVGPYQYSWSPIPDTTQSILINNGGSYAVIVSSGIGCQSIAYHNIVNKVPPPVPIVVQNGSNLSVVNNSNYIIQWYFNGVSIPGANSVTYQPAQSGNYSVEFSILNGCVTISTSFPYLLNAFIAEAGSAKNICYSSGVQLGMGSNTAFGGTPPYSYSWSPDSSLASSNSDSPFAHPLVNTLYHVTVTDANGFTAVDSVMVIVNALPNVDITSSTGNFDFCQYNPTIFSVPWVQGNSYHWKKNGQSFSSGSSINIYQPGNYSVIVISGAGCRDTSITVNSNMLQSPTPPQILVTGQPVACGGTGVGVYVHLDPLLTYQWYDNYGNALTGETDTIYFPSQYGGYTLQVKDSNLCYSNSNNTYIEPDSTLIIQPIIASDSNFCSNSEISLYASIVPAYTYQWYLGGYDIPGADSSYYLAGWPGNYRILCMDTNGCTGSASKNIYSIYPPDTLVIELYGSKLWARGAHPNIRWYLNGSLIPNAYDTIYQPTQVGVYTALNLLNSSGGNCETMSAPFELFCTMTLHHTDVPCDHSCNGSAQISVSGGITPQIIWSTGSTDTLVTQLCAQSYSVHLIDSAGCDITDSVQIGTSLDVELFNSTGEITCPSVRNGGVYNWATGGNGIYSWQINGIDTVPNLNFLCPGIYFIRVSDSVGCADSLTVELLDVPPIVVSQQVITPPTCTDLCDGSITLSISGGHPGYYIYWSDGATGLNHQSLCDTSYFIDVYDGFNCLLKDTITILMTNPLLMNLTSVGTQCIGCADGKIVLQAFGGHPPYAITWFPVIGNIQNGTILQLTAGNYQVCIIDSGGCEVCDSVFVPEDPTVILEKGSRDQISIYPNPFHDYTRLSFNNSNQQPFTIEITDISGRVLETWVNRNLPYTINKGMLVAGIYFITLKDREGIVCIEKVIIE